MTIKEVCEKFGITQDTVRYYEKVGVIPRVGRSCGGTRCYCEEDLVWLGNALCLRNAGMTVETISEYVRLSKIGDDTFEERLALLKKERERILEQKKQIDSALSLVTYKIEKYEAAMQTGVLSWDDCCCGEKK